MDDLISRQAALEMLNDNELERQADDVFDGDLHRYKRAAQRIIAQLPTIEPKRGKWIYKTQNVKGGKGQTYGKWQCSCCKKKEPRRRGYCPNCGAKMERSEE